MYWQCIEVMQQGHISKLTAFGEDDLTSKDVLMGMNVQEGISCGE